jgi:hypothetical protein
MDCLREALCVRKVCQSPGIAVKSAEGRMGIPMCIFAVSRPEFANRAKLDGKLRFMKRATSNKHRFDTAESKLELTLFATLTHIYEK